MCAEPSCVQMCMPADVRAKHLHASPVHKILQTFMHVLLQTLTPSAPARALHILLGTSHPATASAAVQLRPQAARLLMQLAAAWVTQCRCAHHCLSAQWSCQWFPLCPWQLAARCQSDPAQYLMALAKNLSWSLSGAEHKSSNSSARLMLALPS